MDSNLQSDSHLSVKLHAQTLAQMPLIDALQRGARIVDQLSATNVHHVVSGRLVVAMQLALHACHLAPRVKKKVCTATHAPTLAGKSRMYRGGRERVAATNLFFCWRAGKRGS